jgi:hypothetical protein
MNSSTSRTDTFPLERLPAPLQVSAERLLLQLLDSEALYTLVGALKPISVGTHSLRLGGDPGERVAGEGLNLLLPVLRCGELETGLLRRKKTFGSSSYIDLAVYSRVGVARTVKSHREFFAGLGVTPEKDPLAILERLEKSSPSDANRGLGYLYGYPAYAVEDFCTRKFGTKKTSPPSYFEVPTFSGKFAYPAPRGEKARLEDVVLRESARVVLAEYKRRRERYIGAKKKGVVELLRDWFDDGSGRCSPANARYQ